MTGCNEVPSSVGSDGMYPSLKSFCECLCHIMITHYTSSLAVHVTEPLPLNSTITGSLAGDAVDWYTAVMLIVYAPCLLSRSGMSVDLSVTLAIIIISVSLSLLYVSTNRSTLPHSGSLYVQFTVMTELETGQAVTLVTAGTSGGGGKGMQRESTINLGDSHSQWGKINIEA